MAVTWTDEDMAQSDRCVTRLRQTAGVLVVILLGTATSLFAEERDARFLAASRRGDAKVLEALLKQGVDVQQREVDGMTALHWAVHHDQLEIAERLLRAGADAGAQTRYGVTPLSLACVNGNASMVRLLLEHGADPNLVSSDGETVVMTAARTGNPETIQALLDRGASVATAERLRGQTAVMWAAAQGNTAAVRTLVRAGASLRERSVAGFTPLLYAVRAGHLATTRELLELGADANDRLPNGVTALLLAVMNANFELGALLLERGADPNEDSAGWTALHQLAWTRRPNVGHNNPEPVITGELASLELAERLLAAGAALEAPVVKEPRTGLNSFNRIGATPFLLAAKAVDLPLMRLLLAHGASARATNVDNTNALMVAAGVGMFGAGEDAGTPEEAFEAMTLLLDLDVADVNAADNNGDTALHGAAFRGADRVVQLLVDKGASLDAVNTKGWTPLKVADGIFVNATLKSQPKTAAFIRTLLNGQTVR